MNAESTGAGNLSCAEALRTRRSVRRLRQEPVPRDLLAKLVEAATWAPAPHHTKPWRFALIVEDAVKQRLGDAMGERWTADLRGDGLPEPRVTAIVDRSRRRIAAAGALVVISLVKGDLQRYPDARRQAAEYTMGAHSLGASIENLLLAAHDAGLAGSWMCAPLFCPDTVCATLRLPTEWEPQALILLGYAREAPPSRGASPLDRIVTWVDA
ncbi:MAG TPA: nitroreductase family protein [Chloroflexota bacterium]|jgi:F420 biosynthesis protein FbiB-like protein|nr:nitroreductase family protein [Chloroflexota bacterium]